MANADPSDSAALDQAVADPGVFDLLGDDTRFRIVQVLHAADDGGPVPFSRLRERVDVEDSGRFNYHLNRLQGVLVVKSEDGYALTGTGRAFAALVAPEPEPVDPFPTE